MYPKFKINLIGLAVALGFVLAGFGLGEPPRASADLGASPASLIQASAQSVIEAEIPASVRTVRRGALKRHLAMPYVSFAALTPRQES
ncbi:hypothetical protein [Arenimonas terrae]|jgi:hypothetical protein|uniref:Uncharacterized protein n=1 Tax=Arenimonas terrae TaxID=2546226 RepID=A0A5C4RU38_9GAMM|nr:hypothetical protein [Arenimonas terrae]TNJ34472.1 hypothetical protein E1B00_01400 [Arenimonas terrae]